MDADPAHLPAGHAFAWPGSRLNEASRTNELYNCLVAMEELEAFFGDSWLDCENVDARAMPPRRNRYRATETGCALGSHGSCRRCSSIDDPSNKLH